MEEVCPALFELMNTQLKMVTVLSINLGVEDGFYTVWWIEIDYWGDLSYSMLNIFLNMVIEHEIDCKSQMNYVE